MITKFQETHLDWQRLKGQFKAERDKSNIGQVAKFSYLKELLRPRVREDIDELRFNSEEDIPAKNILINKCTKPREVANAQIQCIMGLPVITETNPTRINESYEQLITNVQTLESMGKHKDIRGYVRLTLDKLQGIRADLVRLDDNWQEWRFPKLVEALKNGCERNSVPLDSNHGRRDKRKRTIASS